MLFSMFGKYIMWGELNWKSFADDLVLLSETKSGLKNCLAKLESYCNDWGLKVNPLKTKVLVFNKKFTNTIKNMIFYIDGNPIAVTNSYCYLGVEVSNTGSFVKATDILYKKGLKSLYSIYSSLDVRSDQSSTRLFLKLFDSLVKPVLLYGCEIWGTLATNSKNNLDIFANKPKNTIEKFVNKFYRTLLAVPQRTSTVGIHSELGRFPIHLNIQQAMIKFWFRLISLPTDRLAAHCYWSLFYKKPCNDPWLKAIQTIIISSGQYFIWDTQETLSQADFRTLFRFESNICQTLRDTSLQQTNEKIHNETKLSYFQDCKPHTQMSSYLTKLNGRSKRSYFSKLRLGSLELEIEKGRWHNIPRFERHCKLCNSLEIESVEHFILSCPALSQSRDPFIQSISVRNSMFESMSPATKVKYLFFNESLPINLLEIASDLLLNLAESRKTLLNNISNSNIDTV